MPNFLSTEILKRRNGNCTLSDKSFSATTWEKIEQNGYVQYLYFLCFLCSDCNKNEIENVHVLIHLHKKGLDIYQKKEKQNVKYKRNVYFNTYWKLVLWWVQTI